MDKFLMILAAVAVILLLIVLFGGNRKLLRQIKHYFVQGSGDSDVPYARPTPAQHKKNLQKQRRQSSAHRNPSQVYTEMATLMQKIDERRRVVDSSGHSTLYDEYFELVFETRKGETVRLTASRAAFKEIPFNKTGSLTYKRGALIKFKYTGGLVTDEYVPAAR